MSSWFGKTPLSAKNQARAAEFERQRTQWIEDCYQAIRDEADRRSSRQAAKGKYSVTIDLQDFKYPEVYSTEYKDLLILTKSDLTRDDIKGLKERLEKWSQEEEFTYSDPEYWKVELDWTPKPEEEPEETELEEVKSEEGTSTEE